MFQVKLKRWEIYPHSSLQHSQAYLESVLDSLQDYVPQKIFIKGKGFYDPQLHWNNLLQCIPIKVLTDVIYSSTWSVIRYEYWYWMYFSNAVTQGFPIYLLKLILIACPNDSEHLKPVQIFLYSHTINPLILFIEIPLVIPEIHGRNRLI